MAYFNDFVKDNLDSVLDYVPSNDKEEIIQAVSALNIYFNLRPRELRSLKIDEIILVEAENNQERHLIMNVTGGKFGNAIYKLCCCCEKKHDILLHSCIGRHCIFRVLFFWIKRCRERKCLYFCPGGFVNHMLPLISPSSFNNSCYGMHSLGRCNHELDLMLLNINPNERNITISRNEIINRLTLN